MIATPPPDAHQVVLDGVHVHLRAGTEQVVTVDRTHGYHAAVTFWRLEDGRWRSRFSTRDGRIGYGGLAPGQRRHQGSGTTPLGTYRLTYVFGFEAPRAGWRMRYRAVQPGDFWVEDNGSAHYNRYRNQTQGGFRWWLPAGAEDGSERLSDYHHQYDLSVVTDYNHQQVRHRGAGIFLHVNGAGATAGCVSAPHRFVQRTVGALDPGKAPVIAVGR